MIKVVVLNDTSKEFHHGCDRVMDNLYFNLKRFSCEVIYISYLNDSLENPELILSLNECDLAIINGEGTIHHGNPYAEKLIKLVSLSTAGKRYLINTTYNENPSEYKEFLQHFDGVFVRDSMSKFELNKINIDAQVVPDLTFYSEACSGSRHNNETLIIGDSVKRETALLLYESRHKSQKVKPLSVFKKSKSFIGRMKQVRRSLAVRDIFKPRFMLRIAMARMWYTSESCIGHAEYAAKIAESGSVLSGRYHTICMAIKNETPFCVVGSNTFKIESLLIDAGLSTRIISEISLKQMKLIDIPIFSEDENRKLKEFNYTAKLKIENMFNNIFKFSNER